MKRILVVFLLLSSSIFGQSLDSLYKQADGLRDRFAQKVFNTVLEIKAIDGTHCFWYLTQTVKGKEYLMLDGDAKKVYPAIDQTKLAEGISAVTKNKVEPYKLPIKGLRFNQKMDTVYFEIENERYSCFLGSYEVVKGTPRGIVHEAYWGGIFKEDGKEHVKSPDFKKEAYISEGNLWVRDFSTKITTKLSLDGSPYEYYSSNIYWSPDSKKIICCKYRPVDSRKVTLISSSPKDQLQPKIETIDYPKPGDALPIRHPVVFLIDSAKAVPFEVPEVDAQFDLGNFRWDKTSSYFTFDFNKRGHQQFIVYAGDLATAKVRVVVKEQFPTFVYYNALYQHWFEKSPEMLWISERDGWRHLYLVDVLTGATKKQLTKGEWIVKSVVNVDEKKRTALFVGCGMDANEDPYLEKYYRLNIDNGKIVALTPENANHEVTFSEDFTIMVDRYSRVDKAPVVVVRSATDGKVLFQPQQPDISLALLAGLRLPEVFSAKGRDGKTTIWGVIIRPTHFDPTKKYPVIEYIYAGPHDSYVPKSFSLTQRCSALAELGFITVMIDGMGTFNRSKAFHDVCWKNLKDAGFPDRIAWIKAAAAKYPEMELNKVGIYGVSAGGQSTLCGLLFHPEFYKVGVAACGCYDNRMDKIWWNEQWMGYPVDKSYEENSCVVNASLLQGKLMLILGELDDNVDPSSTLQVVDALIKANKDFEFVEMPGLRHTMGDNYGEHKRRDFFVKNLLGVTPPDWKN
jgi:dipeptidyl aminopeptidase/acylaminoacyl peptidase